MFKRLSAFLLAFIICFAALSSCGKNGDDGEDSAYGTDALTSDISETENSFTVALVTDHGETDGIESVSSVKNGIMRFVSENNVDFFVTEAEEEDASSREDALVYAIENGADVIVTKGMLYLDIVGDLYEIYPYVTFLLVGVDIEVIGQNVSCLFCSEEEAGFLAGYAAVMEGFKTLGFYGSPFSSPVGHCGIGFVQGADYAAKMLGITDEVSVRYKYGDLFIANDSMTEELVAWYSDGVELIFTAGGSVCLSVSEAAFETDGAVIGFDTVNLDDSGMYVTHAVKSYENLIYYALNEFLNNSCKLPQNMAGKSVRIGVEADAVRLLDIGSGSNFLNFGEEDYEEILRKIINSEVYIDDTSLEDYLPETEIEVYFAD